MDLMCTTSSFPLKSSIGIDHNNAFSAAKHPLWISAHLSNCV